MEILERMYVRTKQGIICKILKLNEQCEDDGYLDHNDINSPNIQRKGHNKSKLLHRRFNRA